MPQKTALKNDVTESSGDREHLSISELRSDLAETVNRVAYRGDRVVLHRRGKGLVAIVPIEDLELIEEIEDRIDLEEVRKALSEPGTIPWEEIKAEMDQ